MSRGWEQEGRYELKYVVPRGWRRRIVELVGPFAEPDPHAHELGSGRRGYTVRSVYLDTAALDDYFDRLNEVRVRNRLRVRSYDEPEADAPVFLENKRKCGRRVIKHRFRLCDSSRWCACREARPWLPLLRGPRAAPDFAAAAFLQLVEERHRRPVSVVHYEREVFVPRGDRSSTVRLTLDHEVRGAVAGSVHELFAPAGIPLIPGDWLVMELKFARRAPQWMHLLRRELGLQAVPVSKYGLSVAHAARPEHPRELEMLTPPPLRRREHAA